MDASQSERLQWLFSKYLERRCAPEEVEELTGLLQQAGAEETLSGPMEELWKHIREEDRSHPGYGVDWDKMYETVSQSEEDIRMLVRRRRHRTKRIGYRVAAAAILLLAFPAVYWALMGKGSKEPAQPSLAGINSVSRQPVNKKQVIHLPDGSTVILNTHSKLDYPTVFAGAAREVYLSGEAYFDIMHSAGRPFLVHTGKITTRVLGTAFNIRAYPSDEAIDVTVTRGKVQVLDSHKTLGTLVANQQIHFVKNTEAFLRKTVNPGPVIAWKPEEIFYDNITLEEAAKAIEQRFGVSVAFANPAIGACRFTATFSADDGLEEILTVLCGVTQTTYTVKNHKVTLDGKGCG
jgi:transmembrane sensor